MAAVLDAFASKLVDILAGMAKDEVEMLLGVPGEITKLETTLGDLSSILGDAERKRIRDSATERWVRELKDVMYDADNILDLCQIMPTPPAPKSSSCSRWCCWNMVQMMSCFRNPVVVHETGKNIQALNQKLLDIQKRSSRFGFISQAINSSSSYSDDKVAPDSSRKTGPSMFRSDVVGEKIEQDTSKLVNLLVKKVDACAGPSDVVAVTGIGGIGKTTLARMVFNNKMMTENFDKKIWLSVNKDADEIGILQSVVAAVRGSYNGSDKALLEDALKQEVKQKKILLVMDDVWSDKVWNELLRAPLNDAASESRVLVTTRNVGVARGMKAHYVHHVDKLPSEDAWSLLKKQVILNKSDESVVDGLKDVGMKILERCDGLPLAVKVVGGLLLKKSITRGVWMDVFNNDAWSITEIDDDLNRAVYLSYEELPPHLKQCLLYCSLFPKGEIILSGSIARMWMAEGFIQNNTSSKLLEDLGDEYYRELISRNLLQPNHKFYDQRGCTMHDVVRSFAQSLAKDEGLLVNVGQKLSSTSGNVKLRHLSLSRDVAELGALQTQVSLRTLLVFKTNMTMLKELMDNLCCLRVLHTSGVDLVELPESVCHLKHLRYLDLKNTSISAIPQGIGNLKFLQVINLQGCVNISELPESILKLQKLRFIDLRKTKITSIPRGFGKLEDLVEFLGFPTHSDVESQDGWWSLEELGSLSKLKVLYVQGLENAPCGSVAARARLSSKPHLKFLHLAFTSRLADNGKVEEHISEEEQKRIEDVLSNMCPPPSIEVLDICGYIGRQLPQWMGMMSVFESLRRLDVLDYACCRQLPDGLGQLPFLDYLNVERAPSIECIDHCLLIPSSGSDGDAVSFPKLNFLNLEGMLGWSEWKWEEKIPAMPSLEKLLINNCKLSHLPPGLAYHATQLRLLYLRKVSHLVCVDNYPALVKLELVDNPKLERITNNPSLQHIVIIDCPGVKVLEGSPSLRTMEWIDMDVEALPDYFRGVELSKLVVQCSVSLLELIASQQGAGAGSGSDSEWGKIQHVQQLKAYGFKRGAGKDDTNEKYISYTKQPYSFETDIVRHPIPQEKNEDEVAEA